MSARSGGRPKGLRHTPEARAKIAASTTARWADPAYRAKVAAARNAAMADPAVRETISRKRREFLADPAERRKLGLAIKAALAEPAVRAKIAGAARAAWADPAHRARRYPHLAALSERQFADYRLYRKKGFPAAEAMRLVQTDPKREAA